MTWRRLTSTPVLGDDPPPFRPYFPACDCLQVWTQTKAVWRTNGDITRDDGYINDPENAYAWPAGGLARKTATNYNTIDITIKTLGRWMPWRLVVKDAIENLATGVVTYSTYVVDMLPDVETEFTYTTTTGFERRAVDKMILIPAEGD